MNTLDVAALVTAVTPRLLHLAGEPAGECREHPADHSPLAPTNDGERAALLGRALEEWGVVCREADGLSVLEAFGIASARGVEITVATDLTPAERALAYARCVARLALLDRAALATWFHYRPGASPAHETAAERRTMAVVDALARALLAGRLEAAPRYLRLAPATPEAAPAAASILGGCSQALLCGLHRASSALYWRSTPYQALRASAPMVRLTTRVHALLSGSAGGRAA